ncbi:MAG TPA: polymer-forming cytoskeletal protein [Candidatus Angelobacter sp.]|nr:polymer-forming cytoskeletal protein [Candidatus Angelobacter sp.]
MWKPRPDEKPVSSNPMPQANTPAPSAPATSKQLYSEPAKTSAPFRAEVAAHIGKSVVVKGELSGSEDLYLDGEVEGTIEMRDHSLVVGPNGRIRAHITAREVVVHGKVDGNISGSERVELKRSCVLTGDIVTQSIVIEDGAYFKGSVDVQRESKHETRKAAAAAGAGQSSAVPVVSAQASFLEHK